MEASQSAPGVRKSLRLQRRMSRLLLAGQSSGSVGQACRQLERETARKMTGDFQRCPPCVLPDRGPTAWSSSSDPLTQPWRWRRMKFRQYARNSACCAHPMSASVASGFALKWRPERRLPTAILSVDVPGPQVIGSRPAHVAAFQRLARFDFSSSLSSSHAAPAIFASSPGVAWALGSAIRYFAHRPKPIRREVTLRRWRARSYVRGAIPAQSALASTSAAARSLLASSARSQATATSIFFGLGAWPLPSDLDRLSSERMR